MKFLFDLFPVILFFGMFSWAERNPDAARVLADRVLPVLSGQQDTASSVPILLATAIAILATVAQVVYLKSRRKKVEVTLWVSLCIIVIFGGATIYFGSELFIKWKPTILYWIFAGALLFCRYLLRKNLIQAMLQKQVSLPPAVWSRLNLAWAIFFLFLGGLNLYIAFWGG
ncbi:MAG: septation protein A, partial [Burkholderiaceae bacterium]|nr:septation protein A [Burkholderiaceae bacterium]